MTGRRNFLKNYIEIKITANCNVAYFLKHLIIIWSKIYVFAITSILVDQQNI